jgi:hypothetical protein
MQGAEPLRDCRLVSHYSDSVRLPGAEMVCACSRRCLMPKSLLWVPLFEGTD